MLHQFFVDRCRANLHVVIVLEYLDTLLQQRIIRFPKVFHLASMNFLDEWDEDARAMVRWGCGLGCWAGSGSRACLMRVQWQWYGAGVLGV